MCMLTVLLKAIFVLFNSPFKKMKFYHFSKLLRYANWPVLYIISTICKLLYFLHLALLVNLIVTYNQYYIYSDIKLDILHALILLMDLSSGFYNFITYNILFYCLHMFQKKASCRELFDLLRNSLLLF